MSIISRSLANSLTRRQALTVAAGLVVGCYSGYATAQTTSAPLYKGVNLAGAEFGKVPGRLYYDYVYPTNKEIDYYVAKGMNTFRVPFRWARLQPILNGPLQPPDIDELDRVVGHATGRGAYVILDPHNYGRRNVGEITYIVGESSEVTSEHFAHLWASLARRYRSNQKVMFGLMNEPHDQNSSVLVSVLNHAIRTIRGNGARNLVLVPGNFWTTARTWVSSGNGRTMLGINDPVNNYAFEVHQYMDSNSSGTSSQCVEGAGSSRLSAFTDWARANNRKGFLAEFGVASNETCLAELNALLQYVRSNSDVWIGWTYWAGGAWWGDYPFSIEPESLEQPVDRPHMQILAEYL